jgi:DNA invertase Pin-like site-specific DNA recombinase
LSAEPSALPRFVSYLRSFLDKPGRPEPSLLAQREIVSGYLATSGNELVQEFVERETGKKRAERPQLDAALEFCREHGVGLVIAKLGRIGGNLQIIAGLIDSGVDFVAVDNPHANRLTIGVLAAVAADETRQASERTKSALAAAKARGVKLGNPNGARALRGKQVGNEAAIAVIKSQAQVNAASAYAQIQAIISEGGSISLAAIAKALNERHVRAPRGGLWYPTSVKLVLNRVGADPTR